MTVYIKTTVFTAATDTLCVRAVKELLGLQLEIKYESDQNRVLDALN